MNHTRFGAAPLSVLAAVAALALGADVRAQETDPRVREVEHDSTVFAPGPTYAATYDFQAQLDVYGNKHLNPTQRPLLEWGRKLYAEGPFRPAPTPFGEHNIMIPQLLVYGDLRTGAGYNTVGDADGGTWGNRLNLDIDLKLTATERVHALLRPLDQDGRFTRVDFGGEGDTGFQEELNADPAGLFFEGDLGAIWGGLSGRDAPFDLPIAAGLMPLLFHNGTWLEDAFTGFAFTIPARNSSRLDWSNYDISFFAGFDRISNSLFGDAPGADLLLGMNTFIEAYSGYIEAGYAYVGHSEGVGLDYHSVGLSFTRRYGGRVSNSVRYIGAFGQDPDGAEAFADGHLLLIENSLITSRPSTVVPYLNLFIGLDRPASAVRDPRSGGILRNTGLSFEAEPLTGFPALDASAWDAVGGALGLNLLGSNLNRQLVLEVAATFPHTTGEGLQELLLPGPQYAAGVRAQQNLTKAVILRVDGIYGIRAELGNVSGARLELRHKF